MRIRAVTAARRARQRTLALLLLEELAVVPFSPLSPLPPPRFIDDGLPFLANFIPFFSSTLAAPPVLVLNLRDRFVVFTMMKYLLSFQIIWWDRVMDNCDTVVTMISSASP